MRCVANNSNLPAGHALLRNRFYWHTVQTLPHYSIHMYGTNFCGYQAKTEGIAYTFAYTYAQTQCHVHTRCISWRTPPKTQQKRSHAFEKQHLKHGNFEKGPAHMRRTPPNCNKSGGCPSVILLTLSYNIIVHVLIHLHVLNSSGKFFWSLLT